MGEEKSSKIPIFEGTNFGDWKYRMQTFLDREDLWDLVTKGKEEMVKEFDFESGDSATVRKRKEEGREQIIKKDKICKSYIVDRLSNDFLTMVRDKTSAFDMWSTLSDRFEKATLVKQAMLLKQFHSLKYKPKEETFVSFCLKFDRFIRELRETGEKMNETSNALQFTFALPSEYSMIVNNLQMLETSNLTMNLVRVKVEEFELTRSENKKNSEVGGYSKMVTTAAFSARGGRGSYRYAPYFKHDCNNCGFRGHRKFECWKPGGGAYRGRGGSGRGVMSSGRGLTQDGRGRGFGNRGGGFISAQQRGGYQSGRGRSWRSWSRGGYGRGEQTSSAGVSSSHGQNKLKRETATAAITNDELTDEDEEIVYSFVGEELEVPETIVVTTPLFDDKTEEPTSAKLCFRQEGHDPVVKFILDSGASRHLVKTDVLVSNKKRLRTPITIQVAKSSTCLYAHFKGVILCEAKVNAKIKKIDMEVLILENLAHNLISISTLEKQGYCIIFNDGKCSILKDEKLIAQGLRETSLYGLMLTIVKTRETSLLAGNKGLWHKRLGHLSNQNLQKLSGMVIGVDRNSSKEDGLCDICIQGKQAKKPFSGTRCRATKPLERVHSDLCGPISPTAYNGVRYILTFIDDFTHFTVVYGLKKKSQVVEFFKTYEARVTNRFSKRIQNFRCDNGGEYVNEEMQKFFTEKGIKFEFTIPYTPELNGVAERLNKTILQIGRCMLLGCSLRKDFWIEATLTAVYLLNRSPTRAIEEEKVPFELWYGYKPDLSNLRVFGCVVFIRIPKELITGKFDSRSKPGIMLGYAVNGYRLWSIEEKRVVVARDVIFDENRTRFETDNCIYNCKNSKTGENVEEHDDMVKVFGDFNKEEESDPNERDDEDVEDDQYDHFPEVEEFVDAGNNDESGIRRSTRVRIKPSYLKDYVTLAMVAKFVESVCQSNEIFDNKFPVSEGDNMNNVNSRFLDVLTDVPMSYEELRDRKDKAFWLTAVQEELQALHDNDTWELVPLTNKRPINSKWVFVLKQDGDGNIDRYRARLVVKGCSQTKGIDFDETYAPVARMSTVRIFLCLINKENMFVNQLDVKSAFLNGILQEEIYMWPPEGLQVPSGQVCKLKKTMYGLKQASFEWNRKFDNCVKGMGFKQCISDKCLYVKIERDVKLYLLLYVDDFLIASNNQSKLNSVKEKLASEFKMRDLGEVSYFLGVKITRTNNGMFLSQESYLQKVLQKFKMDTSKPVKTPLEVNPCLDSSGTPTTEPYKELIGSLMYACMATRPDICAAVNLFSQFQSNATDVHFKGLKRILRYIQGTKDLSLWFKGNSYHPLVLYVDADYANEPGRKSISGFVIEMFGDPVLWGTRKQKSVALSSTEADIPVYEDNQACIHALKSWDVKRLKHIDIKYNFVKDLYHKKVIDISYVPSTEQTADIMTKGLPFDVFVKHRENLGMCVIPK